MRPLLLTSGDGTIAHPRLGRGLDPEVRRIATLPPAGDLDPARPTVVLLDRALLAPRPDDSVLRALARRAALVGAGARGEATPGDGFPVELLTSFVPGDAPAGLVLVQLRGAFRHAASQAADWASRTREREQRRDLADLTRLGVALSAERDPDALLALILTQARRLTGSDAGSLYLVERTPTGCPARLRFRLSQNASRPDLAFGEFTVPIDGTSVAGHVAATGEPLVLEDAYLLPDEATYRQNRSFDERFAYRTKSMLVLPMTTHRDEVVGVLQLINRKRAPNVPLDTPETVEREVIAYDRASVERASAVAAQAAVTIEKTLLYESIERLFEGFVTAAVTAIETRDPATFGHSARVAALSVALAEAVQRDGGRGAHRGVRFSRDQLRELRYAALLHDFGKVAVRERVLLKERKLHPGDLEVVRQRFAYALQAVDLEFERKQVRHLLQDGQDGHEQAAAESARERDERKANLRRWLDIVVKANDPSVLPAGCSAELRTISEQTFVDHDGVERPLLTAAELRLLSIRQGTLDDAERREVESHVAHTFRFLQQIPWTPELRGVPDLALGHHEKLNGRGYPQALAADAIPLRTRIMTIADIFDALTATDRPYKPALPPARAIDILRDEAREGMLDADLLATFVEARVWEEIGDGPRATKDE